MSNPISILSTKILLSHQKQALLNAGFLVTEANFITTKYLDFELPAPHLGAGGLIFTSQNAAQSVLLHPKCEELKSKKVFCVGMQTKALLEENGFNVVAYTGYAADLAEIISLIYNKESFTFFSGNLRRDILPNTLKENQIGFNEIQVYETDLSPKKITKKLDGILFFSPSGVESFLKLNTIKNEVCFCIGETTAESLETITKNIVIAEKPSVESAIAEVIEYYNR